jgi:hypothetical protein
MPVGTAAEPSQSHPSWIAAVAKSVLLRALDDAERSYVLRGLYSRNVSPGQELCAEGSAPDSMYIVEIPSDETDRTRWNHAHARA